MLSLNKIKRSQAFLIHLLLSTVILSVLSAGLILWLYPDFYFSANGGWHIFKVVIAVDLVLGPLLTLILFNPKKSNRELTLDLCIIAIIQLTALGYGAHVLYKERPAYLVFAIDQFFIITPSEVSFEGAEDSDLTTIVAGKPKVVWAKRESDPKKAQELLFASMTQGIDIQNFAKYYEPIEKHIDKVLQKSIDPKKAMQQYPDIAKTINQATNNNPNNYHYITARGKDHDFTLLLNKQGEIVRGLSINPDKLENPDTWQPKNSETD